MDNEVRYLYLDDVIPNRFQPRENFDEQALKELAVSIKEHGVIQPIIVRQIGDKYEIIAGERRYKASTMAGLTKIPAIVKNLDDKESSKVALIENLQRRDLTPIEEARTYQKILELDALTQEELARTMGKSQSAVSNKLRLLTLTDEVQDALLHEQISERHARSLLNVQNPEMQKQLLNKVISSRMTVRELDEEIKNIVGNSEPESNSDQGQANVLNPANPLPQELMQPNINQPEQAQNSNDSINQESNRLFGNINDKAGEVSTDTVETQPINNELNNLVENNVEVPTEKPQPEPQTFGGNLFANLSPEPNPEPVSPTNNASDVDVIGGSGLLAGMNSADTIKQTDETNVQNNLYQNFNENVSNFGSQMVNPQQNDSLMGNNSQAQEKTIPAIVDEFKDVATNIRNTGKRIELEEFDFDDFYQLVIRIDK